MINVVFFFSFLILLYAVSAQFYSISYLQLKSPKEDKMSVSQCCLCCPLVFLCNICIVAFFSISALSAALCCTLASCLHDSGYFWNLLFCYTIGFLSTQNRWIRLPRLHLKLLSRPGGRGALPMMAYARRLRPKGVSFSGFRYKRVGISLVEVYKRVGKSVVWVWKGPRANRWILIYGFTKSRKRSIFEIDSYLKRHRAIQKNGNLSSPRWVLSPNSKNIN